MVYTKKSQNGVVRANTAGRSNPAAALRTTPRGDSMHESRPTVAGRELAGSQRATLRRRLAPCAVRCHPRYPDCLL
jgi:hypothetical protein